MIPNFRFENKRVLEKFEIERLHWCRQKVDFKSMTETELSLLSAERRDEYIVRNLIKNFR